jgi:hypothetical protein
MANHLVCITAIPQDHDEIEQRFRDEHLDIEIHRFTHRAFAQFNKKIIELAADTANKIVVLTAGVLDYDGVDINGPHVVRAAFKVNPNIRSIVLSAGPQLPDRFLNPHNAIFIEKWLGATPDAPKRRIPPEVMLQLLPEVRDFFEREMSAEARNRVDRLPATKPCVPHR